jgi:hypothetical protein
MVIAVQIPWVLMNDSSLEERHSTPEMNVSADGGADVGVRGKKQRKMVSAHHLFGIKHTSAK